MTQDETHKDDEALPRGDSESRGFSGSSVVLASLVTSRHSGRARGRRATVEVAGTPGRPGAGGSSQALLGRSRARVVQASSRGASSIGLRVRLERDLLHDDAIKVSLRILLHFLHLEPDARDEEDLLLILKF